MSAPRPFWLAATALILISLLPFFVVDVPAVSDYPNHLARIFILAHPNDPILSTFYAPHWTILPNLGLDILGVGLLKVLPVHVGGRILLAMSLLAPPLGVFAYARAAFGRLTVWSLATILTAFNGIFFLGFMNFLLSVGLAFAAAGAWLSLRRGGRDGLCLLVGGLSSALLFLCHIFGLALFALLILCQELAREREPAPGTAEARARSIALIAGALVPALLLYLLSPLSGHDSGIQGWDGKHKLWGLFIPFMTTSKTLTLVTAFAVFSLIILRWRQAIFAPGTKLALIILALIYLAAPVTFKGGTLIDIRLSLMMGLLLFAGVDPQLTAPWKNWGMVTVAFLVGLRSLTTGLAWYDHRGDLADLRSTLARISRRCSCVECARCQRAKRPCRTGPQFARCRKARQPPRRSHDYRAQGFLAALVRRSVPAAFGFAPAIRPHRGSVRRPAGMGPVSPPVLPRRQPRHPSATDGASTGRLQLCAAHRPAAVSQAAAEFHSC